MGISLYIALRGIDCLPLWAVHAGQQVNPGVMTVLKV
jgi:hypothetical protein